jgi:hypothetical protein
MTTLRLTPICDDLQCVVRFFLKSAAPQVDPYRLRGLGLLSFSELVLVLLSLDTTAFRRISQSGKEEALLVATACSKPPQGRAVTWPVSTRVNTLKNARELRRSQHRGAQRRTGKLQPHPQADPIPPGLGL